VAALISMAKQLGTAFFFLMLVAGNANLWASVSPNRSQDDEPRFWYCPKCGYEMPYEPWQRKRWIPCPNCGKQGRFLEPFNYSHAKTDRNPFSPTMLAAIGGVAVAGLAFAVFRLRRSKPAYDAGEGGL
jgi:hypothetical protein